MGIIGIQAERYRYNDFKGIDIGTQTIFQPDIPAHFKVIQYVRFQDYPDNRIYRRCCHIEQFSDFPCRYPDIVTGYDYRFSFYTRVRDNILKSKEQKNIQPTKGGHKMVTCQNHVSLFYRQITSCPSDGGIS